MLHWTGINECIADLHGLFPRQFCLVDGIEGMEGNGPILGTAKHSRVVIAGTHPPSVDAACCRIMGIDPVKVAYLNLVGQPTVRQIEETIASVQTNFELLPELAHYRLKT